MWASRMRQGFTVVELAVVIVVLAILVTISAVSYRAVQNDARDTAVKVDLAGFRKVMEEYKREKGAYPNLPADLDTLKNFTVTTKSNYAKNMYNVSYCKASADDGTKYAIVAESASGKTFVATETSQPTQRGTIGSTSTSAICQNSELGSGYAYVQSGLDNGTWRAWVKGPE